MSVKKRVVIWAMVLGAVLISPMSGFAGGVGEQNVELVKQLYVPLNAGDFQGFLDLLTDDVEWYIPGNEEVLPWAGSTRGKDQVANLFGVILAENLKLELFEQLDYAPLGEDKVVVLGRERFRIIATGKSVEFEMVHVYTIRNGKIAKNRIYEDTAPIEAAFRR